MIKAWKSKLWHLMSTKYNKVVVSKYAILCHFFHHQQTLDKKMIPILLPLNTGRVALSKGTLKHVAHRCCAKATPYLPLWKYGQDDGEVLCGRESEGVSLTLPMANLQTVLGITCLVGKRKFKTFISWFIGWVSVGCVVFFVVGMRMVVCWSNHGWST